MQNTKIRLLIGAAIMLAPHTAWAADEPQAAAGGAEAASASGNPSSAEIIVTGSRIARRDLSSPSPIVTATSEDLSESGQVNLEQSLSQLPQFSPGQGQATNPLFGGGRATVNLRGLGEQRNLVLLDGRRLPGSASNNAVDINMLPQIVIGSVETISGGASAVYGSDAMSGVVNFKTRTNFTGIMMDGQAGVSSRGDATQYDIGVLAGTRFADDRGHVQVAASYTERGLVTGRDRCEFYCGGGTPSGIFSVSRAQNSAANPYSAAAINAVFARYGFASGVNTTAGQSFGINPNNSLFAVLGGQNLSQSLAPDYALRGTQAFQLTGPDNYIIVPQKRYSLFAKADFEIAPGATLYAQGIYTNSKVRTNVGYPIAFAPLAVPLSNPFLANLPDLQTLLASRPNPNAPLLISRRFTDLGRREFFEEFKTWQAVAGLRGDLGNDFRYDVYYSHGQTDITETMPNSVLTSRLVQVFNAPGGGTGLCAGGYNPFGVNTVSEACHKFLAVETRGTQQIKQDVVEANLTGSLFDFGGDKVRFSLTGSYRREGFSSTPDCRARLVGNTDAECAGIPAADVTGNVPTPKFPFAAISVKEVAGELYIPVWADKLNVTLGGRLSDYNLFGTTTTYKAEADFRPIRQLLLRGGYEHAVRAPNFSEALAPPSTASGQIGLPSQGQIGDPCGVTSSARAANNPNAAKVRSLCLATTQGLTGNALDNYIQSVSAVQSTQLGNRNLAPEKANTYTIGAVLTPQLGTPFFHKLSLSVDYYNVAISGAISTVSATTTLNKCFNIDGSNPNYDPTNVFCQQVARNGDGSIANINVPFLNLGAIKTSGIDIAFNWEAELGKNFYFGIDSNVNYLDTFKVQALPGGAYADYTGTIADTLSGAGFATVPQPKWKALTTFTVRNDTFSLGLRWRYSAALKDGSYVANKATTVPGMKAYNLFDLFATIKATDKFSIRGGVNNLFNHAPVVVGGTAGQTIPQYYDVIGRSFYFGVKASF